MSERPDLVQFMQEVLSTGLAPWQKAAMNAMARRRGRSGAPVAPPREIRIPEAIARRPAIMKLLASGPGLSDTEGA